MFHQDLLSLLGMGQREKVWYRSWMRLEGRGLDLEKRK